MHAQSGLWVGLFDRACPLLLEKIYPLPLNYHDRFHQNTRPSTLGLRKEEL